MWDLVNHVSRGRLSLRRSLLIAASCLLVLFATICALTLPAYAEPAPANRQGDSITYDNRTYTLAPSEKLPKLGMQVSGYYSQDTTANKIYFLLVEGDEQAAKNATEAKYVSYDVAADGTLSNLSPSPPASVTIATAPTSLSSTGTAAQCNGSITKGIGWFICPLGNFLASGMDHIYDILTKYLSVPPIPTDQNSSIHRMWSIVRDLANVCFVIVFLVIVYSQITSLGLSNYNLKRMIPRLILAAILVNISYWICALLVDISNMLGHSIYNTIMGIYRSLNSADQSNMQLPTWSDLTAFILSNGEIAAAAAGGFLWAKFAVVGATGGLTGALVMLLPMLVGLLVAVLIAFLIMAARQALIIILVIISPLAFVAYVLPNTEKYFDKWKDVMGTMLFLFPIFSLLFGGAQLAGLAIIQNAVGANSLNMLLLGMAVQVAPVAITPMLVKFSGTIIGRIANIANNPGKGLIDRTRNWAQDQAKIQQGRIDSGQARNNIFNRANRAVDYKRRERAKRIKDYEQAGSDNFNEQYYRRAQTRAKEYDHEMQMAQMGLGSKAQTERLDALRSEFSSGKPNAVPDFAYARTRQMAEEAYLTNEDIALTGTRKHQAERVLSKRINQSLLADGQEFEVDDDGNYVRDTNGNRIPKLTVKRTIDGKSLQEYATGVGEQNIVLSQEVKKDRAEFGEMADAAKNLMKHYKLESGQYQKLASGGAGTVVRVTDDSGNEHVFDAGDDYVKEAAIATQAKGGSFNEKMAIWMESGAQVTERDNNGNVIRVRRGHNFGHRVTVQEELLGAGFTKAAPFFADMAINETVKGTINGPEAVQMHALREIMEGRLKEDTLAGANKDAITYLSSLRNKGPSYQAARNDLIAYRISMRPAGERDTPQKVASLSASIGQEIDANFETQYTALKESVKKIFENPILSKETNDSSRQAFKKVLGTERADGTFDFDAGFDVENPAKNPTPAAPPPAAASNNATPGSNPGTTPSP